MDGDGEFGPLVLHALVTGHVTVLGTHTRNLLGERRRRAAGVVAEEPADPQLDLDRAAVDRGGKLAAVAAVQPASRLSTPGALRCVGTNSGRQPEATGPVSDIVEHNIVQMLQQPGELITQSVIIQPRSLHDRTIRRAVIRQSAPEQVSLSLDTDAGVHCGPAHAKAMLPPAVAMTLENLSDLPQRCRSCMFWDRARLHGRTRAG